MERRSFKPEKPILDKQALERSASRYVLIAPEMLKIHTPKPAPQKLYRNYH